MTFITIYMEVCKTTNSEVSFALSFSISSISSRYQHKHINSPYLLVRLNKLANIKKHKQLLMVWSFSEWCINQNESHLFTANGLNSQLKILA